MELNKLVKRALLSPNHPNILLYGAYGNHSYTCFKESLVDLPETEYFSKNQISLPCGWWLSEDDINIIAQSLLDKI